MEPNPQIDLTSLLHPQCCRGLFMHPCVDDYLSQIHGVDNPVSMHGVIAQAFVNFHRAFLETSEWFAKQPVHLFRAITLTYTDRSTRDVDLHVHNFQGTYFLSLPDPAQLPEDYYDRRVIAEAALILKASEATAS